MFSKNVGASCYSLYNSGSSFSFSNSISAKNVMILGANMTFSSHLNNRTVGNIITQQEKKFVLSLHYNGDDSYWFVIGVQQLKFKTENSKIFRNLLCLGNISTDFSTANATKTGLYGNVYDFAVDCVPITGVKTIYDIHRYLMKKNGIV